MLMSIAILGNSDRAKNSDNLSTRIVSDSSDCLGAPYLYVTEHDRTANVLKYSRDGCLLSTNVLLMDEIYNSNSVEFRSMAIGHHKDDNSLFIADASDKNSRLLIFGSCIGNEDPQNYGKRHYVDVVTDSRQNSGVDHTYGVCLDKAGNIYISNQHSDCILRFQYGNFKPMELPRALQMDQFQDDYYPGTFVQYGAPREGHAEEGVRAIVHVHSKIWIAHQEASCVEVTDVLSGLVDEVLPFTSTPVGLHHDEDLRMVFVSCRSKKNSGIVYALDNVTFKILHKYTYADMDHPTGMTTYDGILYVAEQENGEILSFDIKSEEFIMKVVDGKGGLSRVEQIVLSTC
eukprot:CAMPEP_0119044442 /NCGR_PEP_ID=MMETSP1177-20130426/31470_1 /TAXON_ID=2985 /ORGANISM="Ochromonas sp, Strain CCMP1899" /LENGTH=344 /DNA_ID=CAMNT_0007014545 /DNA_START=202 /DNA_END=1236 /DNA_ORIENTATION=+